MSMIDPEASLAQLVLDEPALAELFERLGFDFCCGGGRSFAAACAERGLELDTAAELASAYAAARGVKAQLHFDCRSASTTELCDHIVEAHHEPLRQDLERLREILATVVRVHGPDDPRLERLAGVFDSLAGELLAHVEREERELFPACRSLDADEPLDREALLAELEDDHADAGEALPLLRELADGYDESGARCATHRALLSGLHALERDLHVHIHEENNVLFPRVRSRLAA